MNGYHIFDNHLDNIANDTTKTIFDVQRNKLLPLLDEAWKKGGKWTYNPATGSYDVLVQMNRAIGTKGERNILFVIEGDNYVVSAYPVK